MYTDQTRIGLCLMKDTEKSHFPHNVFTEYRFFSIISNNKNNT